MTDNSVILLKDVTRSFGEKQVLKGVSFNVNKGEIFGLLGPSGAGKGREVYRRTGAVLDNAGLYERLSCADNLKMYARIHRVRFSRIKEVLALVGLEGCEGKRVRALSKGMKQRLSLARAILHRPELLFLDEPTSGLDPATASEIHSLMNDLRRNGTTIFLTTHNMDEAYRMCDRIALLSEGTIVECGEPAGLCRRYCSNAELNIVTDDEQKMSLENTPENAEAIASLIRSGRLKSIHSSEPDLGTVFLRLTGKELDK